MTKQEIITEICDRLNLTSTDLTTRVGRAVDRVYRAITSSIGLDVTRTVEVTASTTVSVRTLTISDVEKIITVRNAAGARLSEISLGEALDITGKAGSPTAWAVEAMGADSVTVIFDTTPQESETLTFEALASRATLGSSDEPAFPESFHDILIEGVLKDEYRKKEKTSLAGASAQLYAQRLSELRLWIARSAHQKIYGGKTSPSSRLSEGPAGGTGGGSLPTGLGSYTQTGLITFDRDPSAPFAVASGSAKVSNLDADKLDGEEGTDFHDASKLTGTIAGARYGTPLNLTGGQIKFPAANNASTDVNTLDDYEEGSWTPALSPVSGSGITYTTQVGTYVKVGKLVVVQFRIVIAGLGTASGGVAMLGLPFAKDTTGPFATGSVLYNGVSTTLAQIQAAIGLDSNTAISLTKVAGSGATTSHTRLTIADLAINTSLAASIAYIAAT